jgi:hypothetical protein
MINKIIYFFIFLFFYPGTILAVDNGFTIKALVGDDLVPPTTPSLLSVVPVADSQIDLVWSASSDNFSLEGYVLLRDGLPIATTSLTSFSDVGLIPETLYTYEVYAFDSYFNISTTSNILSTTTFATPPSVPVVSTTTDSNGPLESTQTIILRNLEINTSTNEAEFSWQTYGLSRYILRWGKTEEYGGGYINNETYRTIQKTVINDLESQTTYFYELIGYNPAGISVVLKKGQFSTEAELKHFPPANVLRLEAIVVGEDVALSWQLPLSTSIKSVRIVRSPFGYPVDVNDGVVVFDSVSSKFLDKGVFSDSDIQYYTVFVIDEEDSISSGAITLVQKAKSVPLTEYISSKNDGTSAVGSSSVISLDKEVTLKDFDVNDINIYQEGNSMTFLSERINLSYKKPFTISIPYSSLPRHLKSIVVTLLDPTDNRRSYSFLLRINQDGSAYEATVAPLNVIGISRLKIEIFDFESHLIGSYAKQLDFSISNKKIEETEVIFPDKVVDSAKYTSIIIVASLVTALCIILFWWLRYRRSS